MIKVLCMDVDGTLTDGKINISKSGELYKSFSVKDGCGINDILPKYGIIPVIITGRHSSIVDIRCKEINIEKVYQGYRDKVKALNDITTELHINKNSKGEYKGIAYIGDDLLDIECMKLAEYKGCPSDAIDEIKEIADFVSDYKGGEGAVRQFIEWLVKM